MLHAGGDGMTVEGARIDKFQFQWLIKGSNHY